MPRVLALLVLSAFLATAPFGVEVIVRRLGGSSSKLERQVFARDTVAAGS
jgi:hypothetical protein